MAEKNNLDRFHFVDEAKTYRRTLIILALTLIFGLCCWIVYGAREILVMVAIAYLIMLALKSPINKLQEFTHHKMSLVLATALVYFSILAVLIAGVSFIVPTLFTELLNFAKTFNVTPVINLINNVDLEKIDIGGLIDNFGQFGSSLISGAVATFSALFSFVTTFIISFHLCVNQNKVRTAAFKITRRDDIANIACDYSHLISVQLGGWIRGEFILMLIIGVLSYLGFIIMGVPYALPLAVLAGLLELLPNIGPIVAAVPAVALALTVGWPTGLSTLIFCIVIQQLENVFIVPRVMKSAANVDPIISIIAVLAGLKLMGVFGALIALPIFIVVKTTWIYFVRDKKYTAYWQKKNVDNKTTC